MTSQDIGFEVAVASKRRELAKLSAEYEEVLETNTAPIDTDPELKVLYAKHMRLMAEIEVLKTSKPEVMPGSSTFLYEWVKHTLHKDIENLENTLVHQTEIKKQSTKEMAQLVESNENKDLDCAAHISDEDEMDDEDEIDELIEENTKMSELLQCLHRKLTRRLRRFLRSYKSDISFPGSKYSNGSSNTSMNNQQRSFYQVLRDFIVELQDRSFTSNDCNKSHDWNKPHEILIDETYSKEHIQLLLDSNIIERTDENRLLFHLKEL